MIDKIAKLIALAEGAGSEAEAQAAFAKAQALATKYQIDLAAAALTVTGPQRQTPQQRTVRIGEKGRHANKPLINLYSTIAHQNDVMILIAHNSTYVVAHGMAQDLDVVESLWVSLATTMTRFADELVRDRNASWRTEKVGGYDRHHYYIEKPVTGQGARRSFCDGFTTRIGTRLQQARTETIAEYDNTHFHNSADDGQPNPAAVSSMALVLQSKRQEVSAYLDEQYRLKYGRTKAGSWRDDSKAAQSSSAHRAGADAAQRVALTAARAVGA